MTKRNPVARELRQRQFAHQIVGDKRDRELRRELLSQAREAEADEASSET